MKDNLNNIETKDKENKITLKQFIKRGYNQIMYNKWKNKIFIISTIVLISVILNIERFNIQFITENKVVTFVNDIFNINMPKNILFLMLLVVIYLIILLILAIPINYKEIEEILYKAKFVNYKRQTPIYIRKYLNKLNKKVIIYEFIENGLPYKYWKDHQEDLESAFDDYFIKGIKKKGKRILLYLTKEEINYHKPLYFTNEIPKNLDKEFKIPIGVNQFDEKVYWNMTSIPHSLWGGETNCRKNDNRKINNSILLKE